jgi:hypothetical protein
LLKKARMAAVEEESTLGYKEEAWDFRWTASSCVAGRRGSDSAKKEDAAASDAAKAAKIPSSEQGKDSERGD